MTSLRHNRTPAAGSGQPSRRLPRRRPRLHPRRRLAAYDADRGGPPGRGLPDDHLPQLGRHAAAARGPDDPRVGRGGRRRGARRGGPGPRPSTRLVGDIVGTVRRAAPTTSCSSGSSSSTPSWCSPTCSPGAVARQDAILEVVDAAIREAQATGEIRAGQPGGDGARAGARRPRLRPLGAHHGRRRGAAEDDLDAELDRPAHPDAGPVSTRAGDQPDHPWPRRRTRPRSTWSSSGSASPAPAWRWTRSTRGLTRPRGRRPRPGLRHLALVLEAGARRPALPRQGPGRGRPRERGRARHPDGGHRAAPDPRDADA